jgi:hypothetical protein
LEQEVDMETPSLSAFVQAALREKRIRFGDVRRLDRDILPDGIATREEAGALLALDRVVKRSDPSWTAFLVNAVRTFAIERLDPSGAMDAEKAAWLAVVLGDPPTRAGAAIVNEIMLEAAFVDDAFALFAEGRERRRAPKPNHVPSPKLDALVDAQMEPLILVDGS